MLGSKSPLSIYEKAYKETFKGGKMIKEKYVLVFDSLEQKKAVEKFLIASGYLESACSDK